MGVACCQLSMGNGTKLVPEEKSTSLPSGATAEGGGGGGSARDSRRQSQKAGSKKTSPRGKKGDHSENTDGPEAPKAVKESENRRMSNAGEGAEDADASEDTREGSKSPKTSSSPGSSRKSGRRGSDSSEKSAKKGKSFKQLQRVESKEERDFAKEWDVAARLIAILGKTDNVAANKMPALDRSSVSPAREKIMVQNDQGPKLKFPITFEEAEMLRLHYTRHGANKPLHENLATKLIQEFTSKYAEMHVSSVSEIDMPKDGRLIMVGDTHGQLQDVLHIFHTNGPPTASNVYLFNGDIADRGPNACEIFFMVFAYFLAEPRCILINRGNHESEEMNALEAECGGGFRDEVFKKFDSRMYWRFVAMMKVTQLCTVVGKEVFVVHGGLSEVDPLTLDFIRSIDHRECTMPEPGSSVMQDQAFNDFLWSDPRDDNGRQLSSRGVGVLFGPDVVGKFLEDNKPLKFMVRSHQMPEEQRGYMQQRGGKCITVFSASNYCGDSGNQGAVLIFESKRFPDWTAVEHYAPTLQMMSELIDKGTDWTEAGKTLREREKQQIEESQKQKEMQTMMISIVEMKPEIWAHLITKHDGLTTFDYKDWESMMKEVVSSGWRWDEAYNVWQLGDGSGKVDMKAFLSRFTVVLSKDEYMSFKFKAITAVYESILHASTSLEETVRLFDQDGDGCVDMHEMHDALCNIDMSLTQAQKDSLLHTLFKSAPEDQGVPKLGVKEFLSRFTIVYKRAEGTFGQAPKTDDERLSHEALDKVARLIAETPLSVIKHGAEKAKEKASRSSQKSKKDNAKDRSSTRKKDEKKKGKEKEKKEKKKTGDKGKDALNAAQSKHLAQKLEALFESMDQDGSGEIDNEEFVQGLMKLPGIEEVELSNKEKLRIERIRLMAKVVDHSGDGSISILEILEAFIFEDTGGTDMVDSLAEHLLTVLFRHRQAIRAGARCFDPTGKGKMSRDDFQKILMALNSAIAEKDESSRFMESQVCDLCDSLAMPNDSGIQEINYEDFFNSFMIIDSKNPALGIRLGKQQD
mmetsp:Transcript_114382/g.209435  ORF Transcript_114382/g.209435 Transcript_114382/m.209435 type:complete len:1030 (-) Transcript_114382:154-3243(-)